MLSIDNEVLEMIEKDISYMRWSDETHKSILAYLSSFRKYHKNLRQTPSFEMPIEFPRILVIDQEIVAPMQEMNARYARLFQTILKSKGFTRKIGRELGMALSD